MELSANSGSGEAGSDDGTLPFPTLAVVAIFVVFALALLGSILPPLVGRYLPSYDLRSKRYFRFLNGVAGGTVLGVAFVHSLPDAFGSFGDAEALVPEGSQAAEVLGYAWPGVIALVGALITYIIEDIVASLPARDDHSHENGLLTAEQASSKDTVEPQPSATDAELGDGQWKRKRERASLVEILTLFAGLSFHSFFIGIALGIAEDETALFIAIIAHQFFEGVALGSCVALANFRKMSHIWIIDITFALATPVGTAIGIGIRSAVSDNPFNYAIVNGVFQALSGGILVFVAIAHLMGHDHGLEKTLVGDTDAMIATGDSSAPPLQHSHPHKHGSHQLISHVGFAVGCAIMCVIGIWA